MTTDEILFRASSNGDVMTKGDGMITDIQLVKLNELQLRDKNSRTGADKPLTDNMRDEMKKLIEKRDNPELSDTTKKRCIKIYANHFHGRTEDVTSKYMEKGTLVEDDAITLYSRVSKKFYKKNTVRLSNSFVTGEPDMVDSEEIQESEEGVDVKAAWSLISFLNYKIDKKVKHDYEWQGLTYLGLIPKAKRWKIAHCLVNSPAKIVTDEKFSLQRKLGYIDSIMAEEDESYIEKCKQIERNHIFDMGLFQEHNPGFDLHHDLSDWKWDIPFKDRVHEFVIERDGGKIAKLYNQIPICRAWIKDNLVACG